MKKNIFNTIKKRPGVHLRGLQRLLNCSTSTVDHHVRRSKHISAKEIRGYRRFFPTNVPDDMHKALAAANHETQHTILRKILRQRKATHSDISEQMEKSDSTISYHLRLLKEDRVIHKDKNQSSCYSVTHTAKNAFSNYAEELLANTTDEFIKLWD